MRTTHLAALALLASPLAADLRLPAILSDGAVLQRDSQVVLWGWARPGAELEVRASWADEAWHARVDGAGRFELSVPTAGAGGPHTLSFRGDGERVLGDLLLGEVWLASGQSNMEYRIGWIADGLPDYEAQRAAASFPRLRQFDVVNEIAFVPKTDCQGSWSACTPETWPQFSATAFYFARELQRALDVPVGLISTNWGGTKAEAWTSAEGLRPFPEFADVIARAQSASTAGGSVEETVRAEREAFWQRLGKLDAGSVDAAYASPALGDAGWPTAAVPGAWDADGGEAFDGVVWYRRTFTLPAGWAGRELALELGPIDDMDTTYLDGARLGGHEEAGQWQTPRRYVIPAARATAGEHWLAVRVLDTGGAGGFTGEPTALRLLPVDATGTEESAAISLAGTWRSMRGTSMRELGGFPSSGWFHANSPTALFNAMIAPLTDYRVRGAIWYQGESNRMAAALYRRLFPAMIADWRRVFEQGDFPFYYVQIAPFGYGGDTGQAAELREAQTMALSVANTGMAVTMDIGNPQDIHPRQKPEVGRRLALLALAGTYGRSDLESSGPMLRGTYVEGAALRLAFDHGTGLETRDGAPPSHFELAGEDGVFHPAEARIDGETVLVECAEVPSPASVRYAWGAADEPNLVNGAGLPAPSFRDTLAPR